LAHTDPKILIAQMTRIVEIAQVKLEMLGPRSDCNTRHLSTNVMHVIVDHLNELGIERKE
jgi:hypothetical protein